MKRFLVVPALLAAAVVYMLIDGETGLRTLLGLRTDLEASEARIRDLEARNGAMRAEAAALETDRFAIERAIREDLDLVQPGEIVVRIPDARPLASRLP